jgi:magnesium chelatase accessory protein
MMGNWDLRTFARDLPRLTTPLALVAAENDRTVAPHQAFEIQQRLANASVCSLSGVGHLAHEEQPVLVSEKILSICRAHAGTP